MYYVIKRHHDTSLKTFISFQVPKYILPKNSENIIFEFQKDGKSKRKWVKKSDIILFTDDKKFFIKILAKFKELESTQQKLIDDAQEQLKQSLEIFTQTMNTEIDEFSQIKKSSDVPCILKNL